MGEGSVRCSMRSFLFEFWYKKLGFLVDGVVIGDGW